MRRIIVGGLMLLSLAGCSNRQASVARNPYADGVTHTEPVFYNGKHYNMQFRFAAAQNLYDVNIAGRGGRALGGKPGDERIISEVAASALGHFTCARGQKGRVIPGTVRHTGKSWNLKARCS